MEIRSHVDAAADGAGTSRWWAAALPAAAVLCAIGLTVFTWRTLDQGHTAISEAEFVAQASDLERHVAQRLRDDEQVLRGAAALFSLQGRVGREDWRRYVEALRLQETYPGMQGLGFARWIPAAELEAVERAVRAEGAPDFSVHPRPGPGPAAAVVYLEPLDARNLRALGFDGFSEPVRRAAMEAARDLGSAQLSGRILLRQDEADAEPLPGVVMLLPVYRPGQAVDTVERRRAALLGFVFSPIRVRDLVLGAVGRIPDGIAFELLAKDQPEEAGPLFAHPAGRLAEGAGVAPRSRSLAVYGQVWTLLTRPLPEAGGGLHATLPRLVLLVGGLGSLVLGLAVFALSASRRKALAAAQALRESEHRYRVFFDAGPDGVVLLDPATARVVHFNDQACAQLGYTREEFARLRIADLEALETEADTAARIAGVMAQGRATFETVQRTKGGERRDVLVTATFTRLQGQPLYHCIWRDVTEQKRAEAARRAELEARVRQERLMEARLQLVDFALGHSLHELLVHALDQAEALTGSAIGFYHFVEPDEATLVLQAWSTRTSRDFCRAEGHGAHYPVAQAGIWADCVRQRRPVIHNDYASAPGRKGLPPGHAAVVRELVVPVFRNGRIVSVLGVGNKPADYSDEDVALISRFADLAWDIAERRQVQERLHESDARFAAAFERAPMMMTLTRLEDGRLLSVNQRFAEVSGYSASEAVGQTSVDLGWVDAGERARMAEALRAEGRVAGLELGVKTRAGRPLRVRFWGEVIAVGGERCLLAIAQDVTTELQLQQQLAQAQKLESVGRLAGGVAHDFNNMLAVILGHTDLLLQRDGLDGDLREGLEEIGDAARRSAVVTRQLLAFARKQTVQPKVLDLDETLGGMLKMLRRLIGEDIDLTWSPGSGEARVRIDPSQVDQLLANLCVNSRDAIDGVGRISISTAVVAVDEALRTRHPELGEGPWVRLSVRDDGAGIRPELLPHVFEPFFTTKEQGRGTGLGLATVYGIVRQNGGAVDVESVVGVGTVFHLWLPGVAPAAPTPTASARPPVPRGAETVLLVEDEPAVLRLCADQLRHLGYRVLQANGPGEAVKLAALHAGQVQLLLTDVVMPGMSGKDLATMLLLGHPGMRCLYMSGYTTETMTRHGVGGGGAVFLQKPFDAAALAVKVREALDGVAPPVST